MRSGASRHRLRRVALGPVLVTAVLAVAATVPPVLGEGWVLPWLLLGLTAGYALSGSAWSVNSAYLLSSPVWRDSSRAYFTVGLLAGGITIATVAVALGSLLRPALPPAGRAGLVVAVALVVLAGECGLHRITLPHRRAQVPSAVIGTGSDAGALQFGFEMGCGVRTHMPSNLPYLPLVAVLLVGSWGAALLAGLGFGLGRAAMALGRHHSRDPAWWDHQWQRHGHRLRVTLALAAVVVAVAILLRWIPTLP